MKIAIIGTGAMGSVYAGILAEAGHEVWAIDSWAEHIDQIKKTGLQLDGASGNEPSRSCLPQQIWMKPRTCDLYVIATKADGVGTAAAQAVAKTMQDGSLVLTIQNGLGAR